MPTERPLIFGHRGASIELPENTLEAFRRALELGVDVIETDVHLTADGVVVVHHDATGRRMACEAGAVAAQRADEIARWNVGFGFRGRDGYGIPERSFRVPVLSDVLEALPNARFNIDIKPRSGAAEAVVRLVRQHNAQARVLLTSFYDAVVGRVRQLGYEGETGLSQGEVLRALALPESAPSFLRPKGQRMQIPLAVGPIKLATPALVRRMNSLGYAVDFWVINDPEVAREVARLGPGGIMTDDPARVVPAVAPA